MKSKFTAVSCFYDIGRSDFPLFHKRETNTYFTYIENVFKIDVPLIIFTEEQFIPRFTEYRKNFLDKTIIINLPFSELPMYKYIDRVNEIHSKLDKEKCPDPIAPEVISPKYCILTNSKVGLVKKAIELNPYHSEYFGWLDAGYGHNKVNYTGRNWFPKTLLEIRDKITISQLRSLDRMVDGHSQFYYQHIDIISAAAFVGHSNFLLMFSSLYETFYKKILDEGISDDEQYLLALLAKYHPNIFNLVYKDWFKLIDLE